MYTGFPDNFFCTTSVFLNSGKVMLERELNSWPWWGKTTKRCKEYQSDFSRGECFVKSFISRENAFISILFSYFFSEEEQTTFCKHLHNILMEASKPVWTCIRLHIYSFKIQFSLVRVFSNLSNWLWKHIRVLRYARIWGDC